MWPQLLVFDFDGVLVDSVHVKADAFGAAIESEYPALVKDFVAYHLANGGMPRRAKFEHLLKNMAFEPVTALKLDALCERFAQQTRRNIVSAAEIPGTTELLNAVPKHVTVGILSATPEEELRDILRARQIDHHFSLVAGSPAKKPQMLKQWREHFSHLTSHLYLGDALSDFLAAKDAGWPFVGVAAQDGTHPFDEDVHVVKDMRGLMDYFCGGH